ncbi:MAG TPA: DUF1176 domain-containing protein [Allosphingosinicella sp.]|jgi:hypothetical protein
MALLPLPLLLLGAAAAAAPQPGKLKAFGDWAVGCDNGRACHAVALVPEERWEGAVTMSVRRGPEANAPVVLHFFPTDDTKVTGMRAYGQPLPVRLTEANEGLQASADDMGGLLSVIRGADKIELLGSDGAVVGTVTLAGSSAALLYMDEQQKRLGTVTALMRPGTRPASAVPPPPPLPVVQMAPAPSGAPMRLSDARLKAIRLKANCGIDEVGGPIEEEIYQLSPGKALLMLSCGSGAYNVSYVPHLLTVEGKTVKAAYMLFDITPEWWDDKKPVLVNAEWNPEHRLLGAFSKGRGLGDCGETRSYAWDGTRFRLVEQAEMDQCQGSVDYITTWRAEVRR